MSKFYEEGTKRLNEAVAADEQKRFAEAKELYIAGIEIIKTGIKYETNDKTKVSMLKMLGTYATRAELIKAHLDQQRNGGGVPQSAAAGPGVRSNPAGATFQRPSGNNGGGGVGAPPDTIAADVNAMFVRERPEVAWSDVIGLEVAKSCLKKTIIVPLQLPHLFGDKAPLSAWKGILLYGPPGTGKTMLVRAVATESKCNMITVGCSNIFKKYVGESEGTIRSIFEAARASKPVCIIFFDEIDSVASERTGESSETSVRTVTELLTQMDGLQTSSNADVTVIVVAATNRPWALDSGLQRRLTRRIYIPLPDLAARAGIFKKLVEKFRAHEGQAAITEQDIQFLAESTEGYSSADIASCFNDACYGLLNKLLDATHFRMENGRFVPCSPGADGAEERSLDSIPAASRSKIALPTISMSDMHRALSTTKSSVNPDYMKRYEDFTTAFGMDGTQ